jgi:putative transcriptional regulator
VKGTEEETDLAPLDAATDYTYLTLPPDRALRSCIGLVVAGLAARAKIGVAGLDEAVELLERQQSMEMPTRYRFSLKEDSLIAEVEQREPTAVGDKGEPDGAQGWRTVVEMVS